MSPADPPRSYGQQQVPSAAIPPRPKSAPAPPPAAGRLVAYDLYVNGHFVHRVTVRRGWRQLLWLCRYFAWRRVVRASRW